MNSVLKLPDGQIAALPARINSTNDSVQAGADLSGDGGAVFTRINSESKDFSKSFQSSRENENLDFFKTLSKVETEVNETKPDAIFIPVESIDIDPAIFIEKGSLSLNLTTQKNTNNLASPVSFENQIKAPLEADRSQLISVHGVTSEQPNLGPSPQLAFKIGRSGETTKLGPSTSLPVKEGNLIAASAIMQSIPVDKKADTTTPSNETNGSTSAVNQSRASFEASTVKISTSADAQTSTANVVNEIERSIDVGRKITPPNFLPPVQNDKFYTPTETSPANELATPTNNIREPSSILLNDSHPKITPEAQINLGASSQTNSIASVKTIPTPVLMAQSSMHHHPAVQTVAQSLAMVHETQSGITVRLNPPEMGRVFIDFQFNGDRSLTAVIRSEVPETAITLKQNADVLQDTLKDSGFNSVTLSFEQNDGSKRDGSYFDRNQNTPIFYQSIPNHDGVEIDTMEAIPRQLMTSDSAIDLKL